MDLVFTKETNAKFHHLKVSLGSSVGDRKGCYLASGSKDQTVKVWSTARGKGVTWSLWLLLKGIHFPLRTWWAEILSFFPSFCRFDDAKAAASEETRLRLRPQLQRETLASCPLAEGTTDSVGVQLFQVQGSLRGGWMKEMWRWWSSEVVSLSLLSGELVLWDLGKAGKQRWTLFGTSSEGQNHNRIVFNMTSLHDQDGRELLISTSMDREVGFRNRCVRLWGLSQRSQTTQNLLFLRLNAGTCPLWSAAGVFPP